LLSMAKTHCPDPDLRGWLDARSVSRQTHYLIAAERIGRKTRALQIDLAPELAELHREVRDPHLVRRNGLLLRVIWAEQSRPLPSFAHLGGQASRG